MMHTEENLSLEVKPALCVDLDGTIRDSASGATFIKDHNDIEILPGAKEQLIKYKEKGFLILGISNQGGIAYGFKTQEQVELEIMRMDELLPVDIFDLVHFCNFHEDGKVEPWNVKSLYRKPYIGMLSLCEQQMWDTGVAIDWQESIFVGDRPEDKFCADAAGIKFILAKHWREGKDTDVDLLPDGFRNEDQKKIRQLEQEVRYLNEELKAALRSGEDT